MYRPIATLALSFLLVGAASPALAQYDSRGAPGDRPQPQAQESAPAKEAPGTIRPSAGAMKAFVDLQKAINANDTVNIPAKLAAAQAVVKTPQDQLLLAQFQLKIAAAAHDNAGVVAAVDAIAATGLVDKPKLSRLYVAAGAGYYNIKQFAPAVAQFEKAAALDPTNSQALSLLGDAQFLSGQKAQAVATYQRLIQASAASGQKPEQELYKRAVQAAFDAQLPSAPELARQWALAYPSADSWHNAVAIYRNLNRPDVEGTLDLLRLLRVAGALTTPGDYQLYASAAADQMNFNEAQIVVDQGIAAKRIDPASSQFRNMIATLKTKPKATDADLAAATKNSKTATALMRVGDRYAAIGEYAKAIDVYHQAMSSPSADKDLANLHIGMALVQAGDKAGATQALKAVTGARAGIAQYWLTYLQTRG